ncbi:MAG: rubrerythrin family protein [Oscillospiraceae bacterium]
MEIKGTETERNLQAALTGESLARNRYSFFAMAARKAGQEKIADALERMASNEMMHAKFWYERLYGAPTDTVENLKAAAAGELAEWHTMYPAFAKQATADGLPQLAVMFEHVAAIEQEHERQFMSLLAELLSAGKQETAAPVAPAEKTVHEGYRCMFCGAVFDTRPDTCDVCQAIGSFEPYRYEA